MVEGAVRPRQHDRHRLHVGADAAPGDGACSLAKAALVMLCRRVAQERAADGIRVKAVCPGMIRTPLTEAVYRDDPPTGPPRPVAPGPHRHRRGRGRGGSLPYQPPARHM